MPRSEPNREITGSSYFVTFTRVDKSLIRHFTETKKMGVLMSEKEKQLTMYIDLFIAGFVKLSLFNPLTYEIYNK